LTIEQENPLSIIHYKLSIIHYPLSIIHNPLSIIHYPLSVIHYPQSIIHYPLSIIQLWRILTNPWVLGCPNRTPFCYCIYLYITCFGASYLNKYSEEEKNLLSIIHYPLHVVFCLLYFFTVVCLCLLSFVCCLLSFVYCLLSFIFCLMPFVFYLYLSCMSFVYCLLSIAFCLLSFVFSLMFIYKLFIDSFLYLFLYLYFVFYLLSFIVCLLFFVYCLLLFAKHKMGQAKTKDKIQKLRLGISQKFPATTICEGKISPEVRILKMRHFATKHAYYIHKLGKWKTSTNTK